MSDLPEAHEHEHVLGPVLRDRTIGENEILGTYTRADIRRCEVEGCNRIEIVRITGRQNWSGD